MDDLKERVERQKRLLEGHIPDIYRPPWLIGKKMRARAMAAYSVGATIDLLTELMLYIAKLEARLAAEEAIQQAGDAGELSPKQKDQDDLRRMAELFDQSAADAKERLGEKNVITKGERRSAELFRLAANALDLHWAAEEIRQQAHAENATAIRTLQARLDAVREEEREAFFKYGQHTGGCRMRATMGQSCICGFNDTLTAIRERSGR